MLSSSLSVGSKPRGRANVPREPEQNPEQPFSFAVHCHDLTSHERIAPTAPSDARLSAFMLEGCWLPVGNEPAIPYRVVTVFVAIIDRADGAVLLHHQPELSGLFDRRQIQLQVQNAVLRNIG